MRKKKDIAFVNFETVCELARELPGAEESTSYGTPAFKVKGKLFARFHQDGESLVVSVDFDEREEMMQADPEKFYITDHYRNYPWILVRLSKPALMSCEICCWVRGGGRRQNRWWHRCTNFDCEVRFGLCGLRLCRLMCGKALPYRLGTRHESGLRPFWGSNCRAQRDLRSLRAVRHEMFIETRAFQLEFKLRRSETSVSLLKELSILGVPVL